MADASLWVGSWMIAHRFAEQLRACMLPGLEGLQGTEMPEPLLRQMRNARRLAQRVKLVLA